MKRHKRMSCATEPSDDVVDSKKFTQARGQGKKPGNAGNGSVIALPRGRLPLLVTPHYGGK